MIEKREPALFFGPVPLYALPRTRPSRSPAGDELDTDADEHVFNRAGVPCGTPWCNAYVENPNLDLEEGRRFRLCGDESGDYVGVHRNRVARKARWESMFPEQTYRFTSTDFVLADARALDQEVAPCPRPTT